MVPSVGRTRPEIVRRIDVLPAPLAPIRVTTSPSLTSKLTFLTASIDPYLIERFSTFNHVPNACVFDAQGKIQKGVIVRHLLLPGKVREAKQIVQYLHETYGDRIYISLMNQYTPVAALENYPELTRKVTRREYDRLVDYAISLGVENAFIQEGDTAKESFIPMFGDAL